VSDEAAQVCYQKMYDAYARIFEPVRTEGRSRRGRHRRHRREIFARVHGAAETGENEVVFCEGCGYAANIEKATSKINTEHRTPGIEPPIGKICHTRGRSPSKH